MTKELPRFRPRPADAVQDFMAAVLAASDDETHLRKLIRYDDHHFRALFDPAYFVLHDGAIEPSKSQWNTLKKKLKRHDRSIFVFKAYGQIPCEDENSAVCCYIDFGFLVLT